TALDLEPTIGDLRPLTHGAQAEVTGQRLGHGSVGIEASAVVLDGDQVATVEVGEGDHDLPGPRVLADVVDRLLADPVEHHPDVAGRLDVEAAAHPGAGLAVGEDLVE